MFRASGKRIFAVAFALVFSLLAQPVFATDAAWHWVVTLPDGNRGAPPWFTTQGTTKAAFDGKRLVIHLEDAKGEPDFDVNAQIHGSKVTADVRVRDTDDDTRHFSGSIVQTADGPRITLTAPDGEFIGVEAPRPVQ